MDQIIDPVSTEEIESELGRVSGKLAALAMVFQNGYEDIWFHQGEILPGHVRESKENPSTALHK
jgi:hypothetical protein